MKWECRVTYSPKNSESIEKDIFVCDEFMEACQMAEDYQDRMFEVLLTRIS